MRRRGRSLRVFAFGWVLASNAVDLTGQPLKLDPQAPADQPVAAADRRSLEELFRLMEPCAQAARLSLPGARDRFLAGLEPGRQFFVVTRLEDAIGSIEQVFVAVETAESGRISGTIASHIVGLEGYQLGQVVEIDELEVVDWVITGEGGTEEGNLLGLYVERLQRTGAMVPCEPPVGSG